MTAPADELLQPGFRAAGAAPTHAAWSEAHGDGLRAGINRALRELAGDFPGAAARL